MIIGTVALEKGLKTEFNKTMSSVLGTLDNSILGAATVISSKSNLEKYGWMGDVPAVQEWIGDKTAGSIEDYDYTITNRDWYNAIAIDRNELDDDQMGIIRPRIQMLADSLAKYKIELLELQLLNGTTNLAYDGSAFFADRTAPNDNLLAGSGITLANIETDLATMRAAMMKFVSDTGKKMRIMLDTVVIPPELEVLFRKVIESTTAATAGANGVTNPIKGWIKNIIVSPELSDVNDWYGLATAHPLRPLIWQNRKDPTSVLDETQVKSNRKLIFSAEMRGAAGYGFFQMAAKIVNT